MLPPFLNHLDPLPMPQFLLEQFDESLMINGFKLDEEVPVVLKYLG